MAIDDNTIYGLYGSQIKDLPEKINAVKGKARELTTADYNYPADNPTYVALWLLEPGVYWRASNSVEVRTTPQSSGRTEVSNMNIFIISGDIAASHSMIAIGNSNVKTTVLSANGGSTAGFPKTYLREDSIVDNLTSTSTIFPLSANQGKVLKDFIGDLTNLTTTDKSNLVAAINEAAAGGGGSSIVTLTSADYNYPTDNPTRVAVWMLADGVYSAPSADLAISTSTNVGYGYRFIKAGNTIFTWSNGGENRIYIVSSSSGSQSAVYDLAPTTVVQTTGTSTTDVMSQNAVTSMVFDSTYPTSVKIGTTYNAGSAQQIAIGRLARTRSGTSNIAIGNAADSKGSTTPSVAIGGEATAAGNGSIALGSYSNATQAGQMDISTGSRTTEGYNSSNYRLLTGVYDPQSAHDAATKGYVDNSLLGKQDALTAGSGISITDESGSLVISATGGGGGLDPNTTFWGQTASNGAVTGRITFGTNGYVNGTNSTVTVYADTAGGADPFEFSHTGFDVASKKITNLAAPTANGDAATKGYVDTAVAGAGAAAFTTNEWNALWA